MNTIGEQCFGLYTEVAFVERLFCTQTGTWVPGRYIAAGLYSEVVVNRGSTVHDLEGTFDTDHTCINAQRLNKTCGSCSMCS